MPRIRTIKPEFWSDGKILRARIPSRLFFIGLWNFSDDHGVMIEDPIEIKAKIFPADNLDIEAMIDELAGLGLLIRYEKSGQKYFIVKNFLDHQVIDRPRKTSLPLPTKEDIQLKSSEINLSSENGKERKGKERKGKEIIGDESPHESKVEKQKKEIDALVIKYKKAWVEGLPKYSLKYPGLDLAFQWQNIEDWIRRKLTKARDSAQGDLNLFFQRWLNKEKPDFHRRPGISRGVSIVSDEDLKAMEKTRRADRIKDLMRSITSQKELLSFYTEAMNNGGLDAPSMKKMEYLPEQIKDLEDKLAEEKTAAIEAAKGGA